jgi:hypothetical protein
VRCRQYGEPSARLHPHTGTKKRIAGARTGAADATVSSMERFLIDMLQQ